MVECCFTSTETVALIRTKSPGRPPRLSHSSWTLYVAWAKAFIPKIHPDIASLSLPPPPHQPAISKAKHCTYFQKKNNNRKPCFCLFVCFVHIYFLRFALSFCLSLSVFLCVCLFPSHSHSTVSFAYLPKMRVVGYVSSWTICKSRILCSVLHYNLLPIRGVCVFSIARAGY